MPVSYCGIRATFLTIALECGMNEPCSYRQGLLGAAFFGSSFFDPIFKEDVLAMSNLYGNEPERMGDFFDARADGYEKHMQQFVQDFEEYYKAIADPISPTQDKIRILDLGCGTGLELKPIFGKAPNAEITCIDLSANMLNILRANHIAYLQKLHIVQDSYLTYPFGNGRYDYVVSVMTMHHFAHETKRSLYEKIRRSLKPEGMYIEGDCIASAEQERDLLKALEHTKQQYGLPENILYHIDIPLAMETQQRLLEEAGFRTFQTVWRKPDSEAVIYSVRV